MTSPQPPSISIDLPITSQVTHIFSDKTGTLTSNHMEFTRCYVDGVTYGCGDTAISRAIRPDGAPPPPRSTAPLPDFASCKPAAAQFVHFEEALNAPSLLEAISKPDADGCKRREFFLALALNHSVCIEQVRSPPISSPNLQRSP